MSLMKKLPEQILEFSQASPEGELISPKQFLHVGSRAAIDQALSRLAKAGLLMRVSRGLYVAPVKSRFGTRAPEPEQVIDSLGRRLNEVLTPSGAGAANALGLTQQVPVRQVFLTNGRQRTLTIGNAKVAITHAPRWATSLGATAAGDAVRALAWLGESQAAPAVAQLHEQLAHSDWQQLVCAIPSLPCWMAALIGREAALG